MVACKKREQAVSEKKRKNFSGQFKAKVALEAIRGVKTVNVLIAFLVVWYHSPEKTDMIWGVGTTTFLTFLIPCTYDLNAPGDCS
jgi:hypothetical protein